MWTKITRSYKPLIKFLGKRALLPKHSQAAPGPVLQMDMADGSALYSLSLRKPFSPAEVDCINQGGFNESALHYSAIARWAK